MRKTYRMVPSLALALLATVGCDSGDSIQDFEDQLAEGIFQTNILGVHLTRDSVAVGDTVYIHCVIEDSLDTSFEFAWNIRGSQVPVDGRTDGARIGWIATTTPIRLAAGEGEMISGFVVVSSAALVGVPAAEWFEVYVERHD